MGSASANRTPCRRQIGREAFEVRGDAPLPDPFGDGIPGPRLLPGIKRRGPSPSGRPAPPSRPWAAEPPPRPAMVPPDPTAQVKPSTPPPVCSQISGAVISICACRLATLSNWLAQIAPLGSDCASSLGQPARIAHVVVGVGVGNSRHLHQLGPPAAACPFSPGFASRGSRSPCGTPSMRPPAPARSRCCRRCLRRWSRRAQRALRDRVTNDEKRRAVLHRLAGVHEFRLAEDVTSRGVTDLVEPDQRRVPDGGGKVGMKRHDRGLSRKGSGAKGIGARAGKLKSRACLCANGPGAPKAIAAR
jgi:hypothetical protein